MGSQARLIFYHGVSKPVVSATPKIPSAADNLQAATRPVRWGGFETASSDLQLPVTNMTNAETLRVGGMTTVFPSASKAYPDESFCTGLSVGDVHISRTIVVVGLTVSVDAVKKIETLQTIVFGRPEFMLRLLQAITKNIGTEPIQPVSLRNRVIPLYPSSRWSWISCVEPGSWWSHYSDKRYCFLLRWR
jgi:hypothetical protein